MSGDETSSLRRVVAAPLHYLNRLDRYTTEKPYMITFDSSELGIPSTNHEYKEHVATISDARHEKNKFTLDRHGFQFARWDFGLPSHVFDDENTIRDIYYPLAVENMRSLLPETTSVFVVNHLV